MAFDYQQKSGGSYMGEMSAKSSSLIKSYGYMDNKEMDAKMSYSAGTISGSKDAYSSKDVMTSYKMHPQELNNKHSSLTTKDDLHGGLVTMTTSKKSHIGELTSSVGRQDSGIIITTAYEELRREIRDKDFVIDKLRTENTRYLAENEILRRRMTDTQMENQRSLTLNMERFTESNTKEIKEKDFMIQQLREEKIKLEVETKSLRQEMTQMKMQSEKSVSFELRSQTERHRHEIMEVEQQLMQVRAERASLEKQVESLKVEIAFTKSEQEKFGLMQVEKQKEEYRRDFSEKEYVIEKLRGEKTSLEGQIESLRQQITLVEAEKEKNISIYVESQTKGLKSEITQKEVVIEQMRSERGMLEATISSLRREVADARDEGQRKLTLQIESHADSYKREIQQKELVIQQLYAEKAKLQTDLESQQREVLITQTDSEKRITLEVAKQSEVLRSKIVKKKGKIQTLRADILKWKTEVESLKREMTMIQSKNDYEISVQVERRSEGFKQEIIKHEMTNARLKDEITGYLQRISTLEREAEYMMCMVQGYTTETETLRADRMKLETEIESLKKDYANLKLSHETKIAIQLQGQTEKHRKELIEKDYLLTQLRTEKASFESQVESLRHQIVMIESENEKNVSLTVQSQTEDFKKELREKEILIESVRMERTTLERQMETLRNQITNMKYENERNIAVYLENSAEGYKKQIEEKEIIIQSLRAERSRYEEQIQSLRQQIVEVRSEGERNVTLHVEARTSGFQNEIKQNEIMIQRLYEEKSKLQSDIENQRREIIVVQAESQKNATAEVEKRVEIYRKEVSQKETVIAQQLSEIARLKGQMESTKQEMIIVQSHKEHEVRIQMQSQVEEIRKKLVERDATIESLRMEMMGYKSQVETLQREGEYKASVVTGYTTEIEGLRVEREKLEMEIQSLRREMVVVRSEAEKQVTLQIQSYNESNRKELMEKEYVITQVRSEKSALENQLESLRQEILVVKREKEASLAYQVESRTESLQRELRQKEYLIEQLRTEKNGIEKNVESLRGQMIVIKSDYEKQVHEARSENESRLSILVESSTAGLKREITEKDYLIGNLRADITKLEEKCESLKMQMITVRQETQQSVSIQMSAQAEGYKKEIAEKQTMISALYAEKSQLMTQIESLRRDVIVVREESQKSVSAEVEKRVDIYRKEVLEKEGLIQMLRTEAYEYQSRIDALKQEINTVQVRKETELAWQMESKVESVKQEVREKEIVISNLTSENVTLKTQIDALRREFEYKISLASGYTAEIEKLKSERMDLESRVILLKNELTSVKAETEKAVLLQYHGQIEFQRKDLMEKENLITQLRVENSNFEKQIESLRNQIVYMESENERSVSIHVESQTENYRQEIREKEYMMESLRTEKTTLQRQMESLRSQIVAIKEENQKNISVVLESKTESHKHDLREKDVMIEQLHKERRHLEEQIQSLRDEIVEVRVESQNNVNIQIQTHTESLRKEISQKETTITSLYSEKSRLQEQIENLRREVILVKDEGEKKMSVQIEKRVEIYRNEIMEKETLIQQLRSEVFKLQGEVQSVKQDMLNVQTKNEYTISVEVERKVDAYRKEIQEREITIGNLRTEMNGLQTQIYSLNRDLEYKSSSIQGYVNQIETLRTERQNLEVRVGALRNEITTVKSENEKAIMLQVHSHTENHRNDLMEKEYLITKLQEEKASFERQVVSLRQQITFMESENERSLSIQVESQAENHKQAIREKEYLIESLRTEKLTLEKQIASLRNQITVIKTENENNIALYVESNAERYKNEIKEKDFAIESLRAERTKFEKDAENMRHQMIVVRAESEKKVTSQIATHVESYKKEIYQKELMINQLYSEKSKLQGEIEKLRYEVVLAKNEGQKAFTVEVEKRVEVYRGELLQKETEIQKLSSEVTRFQSEAAFLKDEIKAMEKKNEQSLSFQLEYQTESIRKDLYDREVTIEGLRAELEMLKREQRNAVHISEGHVHEIERLKKDLSLIQHDKFVAESSRAEFESLKMKYDELINEKEVLLKARYDVEQELRTAKEKVMMVEIQTRDNTSREIMDYKNKVSEAEQKYYQVLTEKDRLQSEIEMRFKTDVWQKQESIHSLEKEVRELTSSNASYNKSNEENNMLISELRTKIAALQSEVQMYKKETLFVSSPSRTTEVKVIANPIPKLDLSSPTRSIYSGKSTYTGLTATSTPLSFPKVTTTGKSWSAPSSPEKIIIPTKAEMLGTSSVEATVVPSKAQVLGTAIGSYQTSSNASGLYQGSAASGFVSSYGGASYGTGVNSYQTDTKAFSSLPPSVVIDSGTSGTKSSTSGYASLSGGASKSYSMGSSSLSASGMKAGASSAGYTSFSASGGGITTTDGPAMSKAGVTFSTKSKSSGSRSGKGASYSTGGLYRSSRYQKGSGGSYQSSSSSSSKGYSASGGYSISRKFY